MADTQPDVMQFSNRPVKKDTGILALCGDRDKEAILDILNDAIVHTTAIYEYRPRPLASMDAWFEAKRGRNFPVVGCFDGSRRLLGFGTYGVFRAWPAYKYSAEHSLYVRRDARGKGIGTLILADLVRRAEGQGCRTLVAGIDSGNEISLRLHERLGFSRCGEVKQAGFKFGRWLDLVFMQKILSGPVDPSEG